MTETDGKVLEKVREYIYIKTCPFLICIIIYEGKYGKPIHISNLKHTNMNYNMDNIWITRK